MKLFTPKRVLSCALTACAAGPAAQAELVEIGTPLGDIAIEMDAEAAPDTVANFRQYIEDGDYQDSFIHSVAYANYAENPETDPPDFQPFAVQGGGFTVTNEDGFGIVPPDDPIANESGRSNLRGTIAMDGDPDSATSQWFINLDDNTDLDEVGYTVFGEVASGMGVVDDIAALEAWSFSEDENSPLTSVPLLDSFDGDGTVVESDFVSTSYNVVPEPSSLVLLAAGGLWLTRRRRA